MPRQYSKGKKGKNKSFSRYGSNSIDISKVTSKKGHGYHGPRGKNRIEYKQWLKRKAEYYSNKSGGCFGSSQVDLSNIETEQKEETTNIEEEFEFLMQNETDEKKSEPINNEKVEIEDNFELPKNRFTEKIFDDKVNTNDIEDK